MRYVISLWVLSIVLFAEIPPLSFIALDNDVWKIVVCEDIKHCKSIQTAQEPRTYDYNFKNGDVVYIASDKSVRLIHEHNETILLESRKNAFTDPSFLDTYTIMLVKLIDGNSKKTKIITLDTRHKKQYTLHSQDSTALEPYSENKEDMYYANVSCVEGCEKIIQEIWHKNMITGEAEQLTLLNTLSHQPHVDTKNEIIYFSSANNGNYHIWSYNIDTYTSKALTAGDVTDGFPSSYNDGILFIRRVGDNISLHSLDKNGIIYKILFSQTYQKIRNLKVKQ